ncbi:1-aminocyclopropane-1-carboxylate synthase [Mollisia scopiformis]|uniref:1-aminocyclopropane-1-carboxylate synthase n=1 Tax=Mollisia scopiformis TaxID=149040 RepID=A0A194XBD2_MOLSC|nr:1-aminocyclopropane-1-carboxylate synthase [Mollisia scopiformis]KUJ17476.1 1-aminocyclopropane-1-carboxylate synthase [Mollisia scopiformis]
MLSNRGAKSVGSQDIPWRFAPGGNNRYDKVTNPTGVISFGTAENGLVHEELEYFVSKNVQIPALAFSYRFSTMGGPRFPGAMAAHMNEYFNPHSPVESEHIITASGLTAIHELVGRSLADPGDGILVSRPIYGRFELDFGNTASLNIVYADSDGMDPFSLDIVMQYQKAFNLSAAKGVHVKAILIVNPHNPSGRCYPAETLAALMQFCQHNSIHMISDEVYALSVYDTGCKEAHVFTSALSIDPTGIIDPERLHIFYGMSKDFASAGLRLGSLISRNALLREAVAANMRFHNPSGMSIAIATAILEDRAFVRTFISLCRERLAGSRAYTCRVLDEAGIKYAPSGNAGFFLYVDLSPWLPAKTSEVGDSEREFYLAQKLLNGGVGVHPGEEHGEKAGHFRLVFSSFDRDTLAEGLRRLLRILGPVSSVESAVSGAQTDGVEMNGTKANGVKINGFY